MALAYGIFLPFEQAQIIAATFLPGIIAGIFVSRVRGEDTPVIPWTLVIFTAAWISLLPNLEKMVKEDLPIWTSFALWMAPFGWPFGYLFVRLKHTFPLSKRGFMIFILEIFGFFSAITLLLDLDMEGPEYSCGMTGLCLFICSGGLKARGARFLTLVPFIAVSAVVLSPAIFFDPSAATILIAIISLFIGMTGWFFPAAFLQKAFLPLILAAAILPSWPLFSNVGSGRFEGVVDAPMEDDRTPEWVFLRAGISYVGHAFPEKEELTILAMGGVSHCLIALDSETVCSGKFSPEIEKFVSDARAANLRIVIRLEESPTEQLFNFASAEIKRRRIAAWIFSAAKPTQSTEIDGIFWADKWNDAMVADSSPPSRAVESFSGSGPLPYSINKWETVTANHHFSPHRDGIFVELGGSGEEISHTARIFVREIKVWIAGRAEPIFTFDPNRPRPPELEWDPTRMSFADGALVLRRGRGAYDETKDAIAAIRLKPESIPPEALGGEIRAEATLKITGEELVPCIQISSTGRVDQIANQWDPWKNGSLSYLSFQFSKEMPRIRRTVYAHYFVTRFSEHNQRAFSVSSSDSMILLAALARRDLD